MDTPQGHPSPVSVDGRLGSSSEVALPVIGVLPRHAVPYDLQPASTQVFPMLLLTLNGVIRDADSRNPQPDDRAAHVVHFNAAVYT